MELLQLKYFQTVARYEHITQAAKELNIAQPSLSIMISRLEGELGIPLFKRKGRNIELNEFGKAFLRHVNRIFIELGNAKQEAQELAGVQNCLISLATTSTRFLSGLLKEFLLIHPEARFRQFVASIQETRDYLQADEIDFCITSPPIEGPEIESITLLEDEILLAVPATHRFAGRSSIRLEEVADDHFISLIECYSFREITDNLCRLAGFTPNVVFEGDTLLMSELLQLGAGIALLPESACKQYSPAAFSVVLLKIEKPLCRRTIGLSWLQHKYLSEVARSFYPFVVDYYKTF